MDGRIIDRYFSSVLAGGAVSALSAVVYLCLFELSAADLRAIYADGLAAIYIPIFLFISALPGATVGVLIQLWRSRRHKQ